MEPHEEAYIRSRVYEHEDKLNSITYDMSNIKAQITSIDYIQLSNIIENIVRKMIDKRMGCLIDKVVSVYDLYCGDRSLSVAEFEDKVRKLLSE